MSRLRGLVITVLGVLVLTPDALLIRLAETDPWTVAFWRGLLLGGTLLAGIAALRGRRVVSEVLAIGGGGIAVAVLFAANAVLFVVAVAHTTVASTLVIIAATPMLAAVLSLLFLGERAPPRTWAAILAAFAGVAVVFGGDLLAGSLLGNAAAFAAAATMATIFVVLRAARRVNMVPAAALGALLSAVAVLPFSQPLALSTRGAVALAVNGCIVLPVSFAIITLAPRWLPAAEVSLLLLLETVLGPLWVWLGVGERPPPATLVGGAIVIAALALHELARSRR